jgi:hypothetical protein
METALMAILVVGRPRAGPSRSAVTRLPLQPWVGTPFSSGAVVGGVGAQASLRACPWSSRRLRTAQTIRAILLATATAALLWMWFCASWCAHSRR